MPVNSLECEPIKLFSCKNRFETVSHLNESEKLKIETYLSTTVVSQSSNSEKVKN